MKDQKGGDEHSSNPNPQPPTPPSPVLDFGLTHRGDTSVGTPFPLVHVGQWFPFTCLCSQTSPLKRAVAGGVCVVVVRVCWVLISIW